jgi:putative membrane protein
MNRILPTALLCIAACAVSAEEPDSSEPVSAAQMFVTKATQDGLAEIQLGKLAQSRSNDPTVKQFAATMIQDHTKANAELGALAKRKNLEVPTSLDEKHARMVHAVSTKPPSEFDAEYARQMVDAHDAATTLFRDAEAVSDKDIAGFAKKTLITIHRHRQLATTLPANRVPPGAGTDPNAEAGAPTRSNPAQ